MSNRLSVLTWIVQGMIEGTVQKDTCIIDEYNALCRKLRMIPPTDPQAARG